MPNAFSCFNLLANFRRYKLTWTALTFSPWNGTHGTKSTVLRFNLEKLIVCNENTAASRQNHFHNPGNRGESEKYHSTDSTENEPNKQVKLEKNN